MTEYHRAAVILNLELDDEQLARAQARAVELDLGNMGEAGTPESYSADLALARILASDGYVVETLIPLYTNGYTAEPQDK